MRASREHREWHTPANKPWYTREPFKDMLSHSVALCVGVVLAFVIHACTGAPSPSKRRRCRRRQRSRQRWRRPRPSRRRRRPNRPSQPRRPQRPCRSLRARRRPWRRRGRRRPRGSRRRQSRRQRRLRRRTWRHLEWARPGLRPPGACAARRAPAPARRLPAAESRAATRPRQGAGAPPGRRSRGTSPGVGRREGPSAAVPTVEPQVPVTT